jgi:hypothetical protein
MINETLRKLRNAASTGKNCGKCSRALRPDEPVWRTRVSYSALTIVFGMPCTNAMIVPLCEQCRSDDREVYTSGPCECCGRTVHNTEPRWHRKHNYCSDNCKQRHESDCQSAIARQQRAEARGPTRVCEQCGEHFEPVRADARFCSGVCKQRAYRKRVTLSKSNSLPRI